MNVNILEHVHHCMVCSLSKPVQNTHFGLSASEVAECPFRKLYWLHGEISQE
jgi:hypothetical protein